MWLYLRPLLSKLSESFIKITVVSVVLFIVCGLFLQWGFPNKNQSLPAKDIRVLQEEKMLALFKQPLYQTKDGKKLAAVERRVFCSMIGSLCTNNPADQEKNFQKSLFGYVSTLMIAPYMNPPASGMAYVQQSIQDAGFIPKTYAAEGIGFASLKPFHEVWKAFRTVAYFILVLVIIIIGFMIMFQYKIDPHTVISIENALPRIVIALLVITFSYAIAGFLVDLTYLIILLIFNVFSFTGLPGFENHVLQSKFLTSNLLSFSGSLTAASGGFAIYSKALANIFFLLPAYLNVAIYSILSTIVFLVGMRFANNNTNLISSFFGEGAVTSGIGGEVKIAKIGAALIGTLSGFIFAPTVVFLAISAIVLIGILFLYFRILFLLIGAYIQIIIQVMFAPVFLMTAAIPGQDSFASWLKKIFGHLMVFPTVITLLLVIQVVQKIGFDGGKETFSMPLLYGFDSSVLAMLMSGAFLFAIPDLTKQVVKTIAGESSVKAGPGLLLGGAGVLAGSALGTISQLESLKLALGGSREGGLPGLNKIGKAFGIGGKTDKADDDHGTRPQPTGGSGGRGRQHVA